MAARRVATNLTLVVNEIIYNIDELDRVLPAAELRDVLPEVLASYRPQLEASATGWTPDDFARARAVFPKVLELARRLHAAGVPMMIGTDAGGGTFYARELALHVEAGIPIWAVLRMATSGAAQILGIGDRVGRLAPGYEADLTILDADPLADIAAASRVHAVLNNGTLLEAAHLRR
jgi:imidazolonepropionase-like amidohydrolase